jgi:hypothetical protein
LATTRESSARRRFKNIETKKRGAPFFTGRTQFLSLFITALIKGRIERVEILRVKSVLRYAESLAEEVKMKHF